VALPLENNDGEVLFSIVVETFCYCSLTGKSVNIYNAVELNKVVCR
jgi:hypothetical protein